MMKKWEEWMEEYGGAEPELPYWREEEVENIVLDALKRSLDAQMTIEKSAYDRPGGASGLSDSGNPLLKLGMGEVYEKPFGGGGATLPGTAFHAFIETAIPVGGTFGKYFVRGHEQPVRFSITDEEYTMLKESEIDTLCIRTDRSEWDPWDYKTAKSLYFTRKNGPKSTNIEQVNMYAVKIFAPSFVLIYVDKRDWFDIVAFRVQSSRALAKRTVEKYLAARYLAAEVRAGGLKDEFAKLKCTPDWFCKYCDQSTECKEYFGWS